MLGKQGMKSGGKGAATPLAGKEKDPKFPRRQFPTWNRRHLVTHPRQQNLLSSDGPDLYPAGKQRDLLERGCETKKKALHTL